MLCNRMRKAQWWEFTLRKQGHPITIWFAQWNLLFCKTSFLYWIRLLLLWWSMLSIFRHQQAQYENANDDNFCNSVTDNEIPNSNGVFHLLSIITWVPYWHGLVLIPARISNYTHCKGVEWNYFNGATIEVWEWIARFYPCFTEHVITYPCWI